MDYREIIERAPLPILVTQDGRIAYANRAFHDVMAWAGYPSDRVHGLDLSRLVAPEEREASRDNIARLLADPAPLHRNISRTLQDARGIRYNALISVARVDWEGSPALEAAFVLLGPKEPAAQGADTDWAQDFRRQALTALTVKERQIAQLVAAGYSTDNIRAHLGVKDSTVRSHLKAIFLKTQTHSRADLTRFLMGFRKR